MKSKLAFRVRLLYFFIFAFALILIAKLYIVQIVSGKEFSARAERQYLNPTQGTYDRGSIYFSNKDNSLVSGATVKDGFLLTINPQVLKDANATFEALNTVTSIDKQSFLSKAAKKNDPYEEIAHRLSLESGEKINALKIPGVKVYKERWRVYPGDQMAAHVIGLLGYQGDEFAGRYGLERQYESTLKRDNSNLYSNFFAQIFSDIQDGFNSSSLIEGDIVTTIEPTVEAYLEESLMKVNSTWNSNYSGGIIINPKNGEIYAMAISPSFNPNSFQAEKNVSIFTNKLVENVYEMGSIIKPLTIAASIDAGAITPKSTYFDAGYLVLNTEKISNFDKKGRGLVNMQEVLNQSLNTGATYAMLQMGRREFSKYFKSFGLGAKTGIDLPNEASGLIKNLDSPRDIEHATASYGQGIAMTPIATVRALSILANGGTLITPHIISETKYSNGIVKKSYFDAGPRVIKEETANSITKMLVAVVDQALRGGTVKMKNYSIAAKTGTASVPNPADKGYYEDRYLHSFFGYLPAYDPQFLIFLYTYYPKDVKYASETLTDTFIDLAKFLINYYEIPPDR